MKITLFTANNPRHLRFAERLSEIAEQVYMVQECVTVFPGMIEDFYRKSDVMRSYFYRVIQAERDIFGMPRFLPKKVRQLAIRTGDLSHAPLEMLSDALNSDIYVVFGASYIRPPLVDFLIDRMAINIHMGISPYYRGSSCNFWALYDGHPDLVGATIHLLSRGLDSGSMLYHVRPPAKPTDPFVFGMKAVDSAQRSLIKRISSGEIYEFPAIQQEKSMEIRYTRNRDFTDEVAGRYLSRGISADDIYKGILFAPERNFLSLYQE